MNRFNTIGTKMKLSNLDALYRSIIVKTYEEHPDFAPKQILDIIVNQHKDAKISENYIINVLKTVIKEKDKELVVITLDDELLKENHSELDLFYKESLSQKDGFCILMPSQIVNEVATVLLSSEEMLYFLNTVKVALPAGIDKSDSKLQEIAQRIPTEKRKKEIKESWANESITPDSHLENIYLFVFNSKIRNDGGICLNSESIVCIGDGGGRCAALLSDEKSIAKKRNIIWHLTLDLSGSKSRMLQIFRKQQDSKKLSGGTILGVENALVNQLGHVPKDYEDKLFPAALTEIMFNNYRHNNTWLSLTGWKTESGSLSSNLRDGKGDINSLRTSLKALRKDLQKSGYSTEEMPKILNVGFTYFYNQCKNAVRDAIECKGKKYHFHSTLACKVIILLTIKLKPYSRDTGNNTFSNLVERALGQYYKHHKQDFSNAKVKKMIPDYLFMYNKFFSEETFNSGEGNTSLLMNRLRMSCEDVTKDLKITRGKK